MKRKKKGKLVDNVHIYIYYIYTRALAVSSSYGDENERVSARRILVGINTEEKFSVYCAYIYIITHLQRVCVYMYVATAGSSRKVIAEKTLNKRGEMAIRQTTMPGNGFVCIHNEQSTHKRRR